MRMTLTAIVRLIAFLAIASTVLALGVSRVVPKTPLSEHAVETPSRYLGVNGTVFSPQHSKNYLIDTETGKLCEIGLGADQTFEYAACSPWLNERGDRDVLGRLTTRRGEAHDKMCQGSVLGRIELGTQDVLSQTAISPLVTGTPCWLPGRPDRILFPAGDGQLYLQDLVDDESSHSEDEHSRRVVGWERLPGHGRAIFNDLVHPIIPALGGRLFVSLNPSIRVKGSLRFGGSEIWWLRLNTEGTMIVSAGRLISPSPGVSKEIPIEERQPNLVTTPDGRIALAYLQRRTGHTDWSLHLVPVRIDPSTGDPVASAAESREIAPDCAVTIPPFSVDGQWLFAVSRTLAERESPERISVLKELGPSSTRSSDSR